VFNSNKRVSSRYCFAGYKLWDANICVAYNETVVGRIAPLWDKDMPVISKLNVLRDGLVFFSRFTTINNI